MAPGGPGNVVKMLQGIVEPGDRILDIGCGIGGPASEMARTPGASVVSAGALTQTSDKAAVFKECFRVLQPGGHISLYDWTKSEADISEDMLYWFEMEGLTYSLETLDAYVSHLASAGFVDIKIEDASHWYRQQVNREYQLMKGELYPGMQESLGRESADHFVENWRAMVVVCNSGEMRQGYCRARRP